MTRFSRTILTVASAVALSATPAFAQHHGGGGHGGASHGGGGRTAARSSARAGGGAARGGYAVRGGSYARSGGAYRGGVYARPGGVYRGYARGVYGYGGFRVGPTRFFRPYYSFRPRFSLGFGLWAGYPFAYSYGYYDPFAYPYGYAYPYDYPYDPYAPADPSAYPYPQQPATSPQYAPPSSQGAITAQPNQANMGGMSFDIQPAEAQIVVDGRPAGTVGQFTPTSQPLGLPAGRHHVEIRADGYQTMSFDVDITAGQVIPYQGTLQR